MAQKIKKQFNGEGRQLSYQVSKSMRKYFKELDYKNAAIEFEKALELNKNHVLSMINLSKLYAQLPMFLGGSFKKSEFYANRVMINDSIEGNLTKGLIEEVKGRKKISKI